MGCFGRVFGNEYEWHGGSFDGAVEENVVCWLELCLANGPGSTNETYTSRVNEQPICLAALDDLGITSNDSDTGLSSRFRHIYDDTAHVSDWEALLEDKACREIEGLRSRHREVGDGTVDGHFPHICDPE